MREILFKGKDIRGNWHIGLLANIGNTWYIRKGVIPTAYEVIPDTIGQYTGLTDKNGKKIFEGDIVKYKYYLEGKPFEFQGYIDFKNGSFVIVGDFMTHYRWLDYEVEVIGNIHDNPELLKGDEEE